MAALPRSRLADENSSCAARVGTASANAAPYTVHRRAFCHRYWDIHHSLEIRTRIGALVADPAPTTVAARAELIPLFVAGFVLGHGQQGGGSGRPDRNG